MVALRLLSSLSVVFVVTIASETVLKDSDFEYDVLSEVVSELKEGDSQYHDYPAGDYYSHYYEPYLGNTTLHKCRCNLDEVWIGTVCKTEGTIVAVFDVYSSDNPVAVNTTSFRNVTIGEVVCPKGTKLIELGKDPNHPDHFSVLESGRLHWNAMLFENYCVEHTYSDNDLPEEWYAQICLEPPIVPSCCPIGHSVGVDGSCVTSAPYNFSPPVKVGSNSLVWPAATDRQIIDISCSESEDMFILELDNKLVLLEYQQIRPRLEWTSPIAISSKLDDVDYCIGVKAESEIEPVYIAKLCYKDPFKDHQEKCQGKTCVRKCCESFHFISSFQGCVGYGNDSEIQLFQPQFHRLSDFKEVDAPENLTIVHGLPLCDEYFQLRPHEEADDQFFLLENGYLHAAAFPEPYPPTKYCIDSYVDGDSEPLMLPLVCFQGSDRESAICYNLQTYLYPVLLIISMGFLGITLMVYLCVPELHAKVHGKCLLSHITALLMAYISLFIVQRTTKILNTFGCKLMASVTHFSFLSAFFWLNVMCFDIWWTLKSMRPVPETGELSRLRFKLYSLYSWGCPMVITIVSVIIQSLPEGTNVIRPDFGEEKCWFKDNISLWAYFYGFILVLVIANIIFFCQVAHILIVAQNDPILQRTRQQNRERMWLYVKLFLVMGITWLAEVISWQEGTCEAWIFTDIINSLQGVSIFVIFICKRNLLKKVRGKWEPYLRHVKEVVGSKRLSHSKFSTSGTGNTAREQLSFSSSENRPNHSAASHRTVQSQLSFDPSSVNRKISAGSINATTGVQVHTQNSLPMDTIAESTSPEGGPNQTSNGSVVLPLEAVTEATEVDKRENQTKNGSVVLPLETVTEETEVDKGENQTKNGDIKRIKDSIIEEVTDGKEIRDSPDADSDVQTSSNLDHNDDSRELDNKSHNSEENEEETSRPIQDGEVSVIDNSNSEPKENGEEKSEITINANTVSVHSPNEIIDLENSYVYSHTRDNPGFTGDEEDEPIHV